MSAHRLTPARSRWLPLHLWACTCQSTGRCATCRAFVTPGAAAAIRHRLDALEARQRRRRFRDPIDAAYELAESSEGFGEFLYANWGAR